MTQPVPPIELAGTDSRLTGDAVAPPDRFVERLAGICEVHTSEDATAEASRDWWPLAMHWSLAGQVPRRATVVARPTSTDEVSRVVAACHEARVPITAAGGRSGVCGASAPVFGGVVLDTTALDQIGEVDEVSGIVEVETGVFGPDLERVLNTRHDLTVGHFPQSFDISTVGGWIACRGAGQYSTRYGKIEDMVVALEVVLADGRVITTGGDPAAAAGPDLTQVFVGSEGTLGIVARAWLRAHPVAETELRRAASFPDLATGFEACRRIVRRGATPAVLRLYDGPESARGHGGDGTE